jgi:hypothetical protein
LNAKLAADVELAASATTTTTTTTTTAEVAKMKSKKEADADADAAARLSAEELEKAREELENAKEQVEELRREKRLAEQEASDAHAGIYAAPWHDTASEWAFWFLWADEDRTLQRCSQPNFLFSVLFSPSFAVAAYNIHRFGS